MKFQFIVQLVSSSTAVIAEFSGQISQSIVTKKQFNWVPNFIKVISLRMALNIILSSLEL